MPLFQVGENLWLGDARSAADRPRLIESNATYILNVTDNVPNFFSPDSHSVNEGEPSPFVYKRISVKDRKSTELLPHFPECFEFINAGIALNRGVLVHCKEGVSRSATVLIAFLMFSRNWTLDDAVAHVTSVKPGIGPNESFFRQLMAYEEQLTGRRTLSLQTYLCGRLQRLGFPPSVARQALQRCEDNYELAFAHCMEHKQQASAAASRGLRSNSL